MSTKVFCDYYGTMVDKYQPSSSSSRRSRGGTLNSNCPSKTTIVMIPIVLIAGIAFWTSICLFCFCLKRRKVNREAKWVCRRSTKRCACLKKRPRSMEDADLHDQQKAMQIASNNNNNITNFNMMPPIMAPSPMMTPAYPMMTPTVPMMAVPQYPTQH